MKIIQTVPSIDIESSGPSYSVVGLCRGLSSVGAEVELHVPGAVPELNYSFNVQGYRRQTILNLRGMEWSRSLLRSLKELCRENEIVHTNGIWMVPNVYAYIASRNTKCKLVTSPRGTLAEWSLRRHSIRKKLFGVLGRQYVALRATDMFHATSEKEYEEIRAFGLKQPVAIVPIGMEIPTFNQLPTPSQPPKPSKPSHTLAFFGRVHQVKSIDTMLLAWKMMADQFPNWRVVIAGPDCGDRSRLDGIIAEGQIPRVEFIGELNGQAKYDFLASADLYCLPSKTENFGITVAEALACGTPSLASGGTPWSLINEYKCGSWGFTSPEQLAPELNRLMSLSDSDRMVLGENGRRLVRECLSWPAIGRQMLDAYEWLIHGGVCPQCVRTD